MGVVIAIRSAGLSVRSEVVMEEGRDVLLILEGFGGRLQDYRISGG